MFWNKVVAPEYPEGFQPGIDLCLNYLEKAPLKIGRRRTIDTVPDNRFLDRWHDEVHVQLPSSPTRSEVSHASPKFYLPRNLRGSFLWRLARSRSHLANS